MRYRCFEARLAKLLAILLDLGDQFLRKPAERMKHSKVRVGFIAWRPAGLRTVDHDHRQAKWYVDFTPACGFFSFEFFDFYLHDFDFQLAR